MREVRKIQLVNSDILKFSVQEPSKTIIRDIDNPNEFFFSIYSPNQDSERNSVFDCNYKPKHAEDLGNHTVVVNKDAVLRLLEKWINLIREYNVPQNLLASVAPCRMSSS